MCHLNTLCNSTYWWKTSSFLFHSEGLDTATDWNSTQIVVTHDSCLSDVSVSMYNCFVLFFSFLILTRCCPWIHSCYVGILVPEAVTEPKPSPGFGPALAYSLAWEFWKPKLPQAKPKPGLPGQAGPEHHYTQFMIGQSTYDNSLFRSEVPHWFQKRPVVWPSYTCLFIVMCPNLVKSKLNC